MKIILKEDYQMVNKNYETGLEHYINKEYTKAYKYLTIAVVEKDVELVYYLQKCIFSVILHYPFY